MLGKEEFEFIIEHMLDHAVKEFQSTEQSKLMREKLDRMNRDCNTILAEDERNLVTDCFSLIYEASGQKEFYVYRKCLLDCVKLLKWLDVLA